MEILSESSSFGVRLTPALTRGFFVFTLKVGDQVLGDGEPAIEWSSVAAISRLASIDDARLDPDRHDADGLLDLLMLEDEPELYDRTLLQFGEAMDRYVSRGYRWGSEAILLFREVDGATASGTVMARLDASELAAISAAARAALASFDSSR